MRGFSVIILILALSSEVFAYTQDLKTDWNEYKGDHFIIHYHSSIPNRYIREFTKRCERYYHLIAERLNFRRFDYWSWEKRARVFIYPSRQEYVKDKGRSQWSAASVHVKRKFISTYYFAEDFFDVILPHELTHIILREHIGLKTRVPLWFEEGVACANEDNCCLKYLLVLKRSFDQEDYITVAQLENIGRPARELPRLFYPMAASLLIFLLEDYGKEDFLQLCRALKQKNIFYGAMDDVYEIKDAQVLNEKFLIFLENKSYEDIATQAVSGIEW